MLMCYKLLSANLEDADPAVYDILQKVGIWNEQTPEKAANAYEETGDRRKDGRNIS